MNGFARLPKLLDQARTSPWRLRLLNLLLGRVIPFNRPHRFAIERIEADKIVTRAPYRRRNHNHIRGIHACAIATIAEFSSGLILLAKLDPTRYRLIMAKLDIDYLYQAKQLIYATTELDEQRLRKEILQPLQSVDSVSITQETLVADRRGNLVARARITWQVKAWDKVRTKLS